MIVDVVVIDNFFCIHASIYPITSIRKNLFKTKEERPEKYKLFEMKLFKIVQSYTLEDRIKNLRTTKKKLLIQPIAEQAKE